MDVRFLFIVLFYPGVIANPLLEIKAENVFFSTSTQIEHLQPVLDSEPAPTIVKARRYITILSQPLRHNFKWNDKRKAVVDWSIYLDNFRYGKYSFFAMVTWGSYHVLIAQQSNFRPKNNEDYLSAPETLLQGASCSLQTDIWMLGCLVSRAQ